MCATIPVGVAGVFGGAHLMHHALVGGLEGLRRCARVGMRRIRHVHAGHALMLRVSGQSRRRECQTAEHTESAQRAKVFQIGFPLLKSVAT
ncbi:hypothetical protein OKW27_003635 [Paraburkholderia sp. 35.1]